eukprot:jgi/Ulvmu1/2539/UM139_0007.1
MMDPEIDELIEELAFKYLLHLPSEEYENEVQLCYAFQLAHWEYLDAPETEHLTQKLSFNQFVVAMLDQTPEIGLKKADVPNIVRMFKQMNWQIPVFGAILVNEAMDKVLLTQTYIANNKGGAWMFPRGKVEKKDHGNSFDCACREVLEETGFDIRPSAHNDEAHYLERSIQAGNETKVVGLFLVPGVAEDYEFCSQTQGEVYQFAWFRIQDLWNHMKQTATIQVAGAPAKFLHVFQFIHGLSAFVTRQKKKGRTGGRSVVAHAPAPAAVRVVRQLPEAAPADVPATVAVPAASASAAGHDLQPFRGDFDEEMAWEPSASGRFGFEEMVQRNARLQKGDAMRPYDGIIPQQQVLMQGKQPQPQAGAKQGKGKQRREASVSHAVGSLRGSSPGGQHEGLLGVLLTEGSSETLSARQLGSRNSVGPTRGQRGKRGRTKADKPTEAAATNRAPPPAAATALAFEWQPLQLHLPEIVWQGRPVAPWSVRQLESNMRAAKAAPRSSEVPGGDAPRSCLSGLLGSAEAWARFQVDRESLMRGIDVGLVALNSRIGDRKPRR